MLLTLFVIAVVVLLVAWAFPNRAAITPSSALAVLVIGVGVAIGAPALRGALDRSAVAEPAASERGFDTGAGVAFGLDAGYMAWVTGELPQRAKYVLLCAATPCPAGANQWAIARLAPRTPELKPADAEWLVLSGVAPPKGVKGRLIHYDAARLLSVMKLEPAR